MFQRSERRPLGLSAGFFANALRLISLLGTAETSQTTRRHNSRRRAILVKTRIFDAQLHNNAAKSNEPALSGLFTLELSGILISDSNDAQSNCEISGIRNRGSRSLESEKRQFALTNYRSDCVALLRRVCSAIRCSNTESELNIEEFHGFKTEKQCL